MSVSEIGENSAILARPAASIISGRFIVIGATLPLHHVVIITLVYFGPLGLVVHRPMAARRAPCGPAACSGGQVPMGAGT
jgi:hypothetical protein